MISQKEKASVFHALHNCGKMLVLPNTWDPLGALLMESLGYPAVATASAAIAFSNGYDDGEKMPFDHLLFILRRIVRCTDIPVTADIESGYAPNEDQLVKNIQELIGTGIAGINIEDTDNKTGALRTTEAQCNMIRLIRKISGEMNIPLFINARTDLYLHKDKSAGTVLAEIINRGLAYQEAGADGFYPIAISKEEEISTVVSRVKLPVNILTTPGIPGLKTLEKLGVARLSLGPSFLKIAIKAMKETAMRLKIYEGLDEVIENEITSAYLKNLVTKSSRAGS